MADLILFNGNVKTQDPQVPACSAVAIRGPRFLAVGENEPVLGLASKHTRRIDLDGRLMLPGLTDSHFHYQNWALGRRRLRLSDTKSLEDLLQRLAAAVHETPPGRWIQGQGWNESHWASRILPTGADLDKVAPLHPVILWRSDLHLAIVNAEARRLAGLTRGNPDSSEGLIDRDRSGEPTGVLREEAIDLVVDKMPPPDEEEVLDAMRDGFPILLGLGLTGIHDFLPSGRHDGLIGLRAYQRLQAEGELAMRVWASIHAARLNEASGIGLQTGWCEGRLHVGHVKLYADGSQGARTAWMLEDYEDISGNGMPLMSIAEIADLVRKAELAGFAAAVHAIGDRAIRELVGMFETIEAERRDSTLVRLAAPHRIEHVQNIRPQDVVRLGNLNVVGSVQPIHVLDDIAMMEQSVGERGRFAYPFRNLLDAGVALTMGSDCPVADPNPMWGIHAAVTRRRRDGSPADGWYADQCLTVEEAVRGFTMGPAMASGRQADLGSITPGKLADAVILDRDIYASDPMAIADAKVVMCLLGGSVVFDRGTGI